ncbi:MAG TPA: hypothetical protein VF033_16550 [Steroidobacteraceae bacterium]
MTALHERATRIFGISARAATRVVLIRRGPSKRVLLLTWDTVRHEFLAGQWFKGRIYEERCDLSPSGEKFIYLAANQKGPLYSWTANGPWHVYEHTLLDADGTRVLELVRSDWADWAHSGELLFTREGRAGRVLVSNRGVPGEPEELIDLRSLAFEQVPPPREALDWQSTVRGRRVK